MSTCPVCTGFGCEFCPVRIEPAHVIMLRAALEVRPSIGGALDGPDQLRASGSHPTWALSYNARRLRRLNRIVAAVHRLSEDTGIPVAAVLSVL